jgi:hypothetical protein
MRAAVSSQQKKSIPMRNNLGIFYGAHTKRRNITCRITKRRKQNVDLQNVDKTKCRHYKTSTTKNVDDFEQIKFFKIAIYHVFIFLSVTKQGQMHYTYTLYILYICTYALFFTLRSPTILSAPLHIKC